ncbi:MAG: hypothetical protein HKN09_12955 [Saprospiraceae bacterium]|nr:hypothetical protein [Saprospiraceae bacterium]
MIRLLINIQELVQRLGSGLLSILKIIFMSGLPNKFQKWKDDGKTIVILGTGPSLRQTLDNHFATLQGVPTMGLNHFAEKDTFDQIKPAYYMIGAPEIWEEGLNAYYTEKSIRLFEALRDKVHWPFQLFVGRAAKKSSRLEIIRSNNNIKVVFYNRTPAEGPDLIKHSIFNSKLGMPRPHNVLIPSIMVSFWMGFQKMILVGADHSWHESIRIEDSNTILLDQKHYYDTKENWRPMGWKGQRDRKLHEIFHKWMLSFKGYFEIVDYAQKQNFEVLNASEKSYIDAFPRIKFDTIEF